MDNTRDKFRLIPAVDRLLATATHHSDLAELPRNVLVRLLREAADTVRELLKQGIDADISPEALMGYARTALNKTAVPSLRRVINATGVVLHTNLGRAPLSKRAQERLTEIMSGYSTLEYEVETGERGSRYSHVAERICELTGAEAALVVNNNAAAVMLVLSALAQGREVIVSRGQLVEIGGSFRIPDVLRQSGASLVEVGTTNKTHLFDYERAITPETAAILKVHTSNYRIMGFTAQPDDEELAELAKRNNIPLIEDLGSGTLLPISAKGWHEPSVGEQLSAGMDVVTFSGDKLFGGAQAGIIAGSRYYIDMMRKHPLLRAIRIDKLSLAAIEGTLLDYSLGQPLRDNPVQYMLNVPSAELKDKATDFAALLGDLSNAWQVEVVPLASQAGGGSLPEIDLEGWGVAITFAKLSAATLEKRLRIRRTPIIVRVQEDKVILDVRCLEAQDMADIRDALQEIAEGAEK